MAKQPSNKPNKGTQQPKPAQAAAPVQAASPLPTPSTPTPPAAPAPAPTVALRGGPAVQAVVLTGKAYRTAAPHNQQWWQAITKAASAAGTNAQGQPNPVPVAPLLAGQANPQGVPAHFVGYAIRRGYLAPATMPVAAQ